MCPGWNSRLKGIRLSISDYRTDEQSVHHIPPGGHIQVYKVRQIFVGTKGILHLVTHDAPTICSPDPLIKVNTTIQTDVQTGKVTDCIVFDTGSLCMVTGGADLGRIGVLTSRERDILAFFDVVHVKDANDNSFATRLLSIFVIGKDNKPWISPPTSPWLKRQTRDWQPNRAVGEMVSRCYAGEVFILR
ncbi:40S ribosomal protein S4 [Tupaia chinensis]|uniref:40S ribosomal protein S4 n=1 Tax=Tupaia chinensis TaxID=246437 RepID=L9KIS2_TUPCH|nr:40S ribosomal protein S4 [Tupaia chinensis]